MLKNMKKVFFALFVVMLLGFAFACNGNKDVKEANAENCKEFCPAGEECEKCNNASAETCKDFCETCETCPTCDKCNNASAETCKDFCETCPELNSETCADYCETCPPAEKCDYVKPNSFIIFDDPVTVGTTSKNELDEVSPKNAYAGVIWSSSDETILTVDQDGVMLGIRPGFAEITATSVLNPDATATVTVAVLDDREPTDIISQELSQAVAQLPSYSASDFDFPTPWNLNTDEFTLEFRDGDNNPVTKFEVPEGLTADKQLTFTVIAKYGAVEKSETVKIWAVKDELDNSFVRLAEASQAAAILLKAFTNGSDKVSQDINLPEYIFGVEMNWTTSNPYVLGSDGKYYRPNEDKNVTLSGTEKYTDPTDFVSSRNYSFTVAVKGYDKEETMDYILTEGSLANINGGKFNTSIVLPQYDDKFGAKLTFESQDTTVFGNDGKLVAAPAEAKDVKFTVTIDNSNSNDNKFVDTVEITVTALPANGASEIAEAWLKDSKFATVAHTPYGTEAGNVLDLPVEGEGYTVTWNVEGAVVKPNRWYVKEETLPVFTLTSEGKPQLIAQPLRYQEVQIQGTFVKGEDEATVNLVLNVGISEFGEIARTGVWRSSDQGDDRLSVLRGAYDIYDNASHFDDSVGYTKSHYGSGLWSGIIVRTTEPAEDGNLYETVFSDLMYWEAEVVDGQAVANVMNLTGGNGGNWGWLMYNNSDQTIKLEIGVYSDSTYNHYAAVEVTDENYEAFGLVKEEGKYYKVEKSVGDDGSETEVKTEVTTYEAPLTVALGSRLNLAIDGYALGFATDAEGKVIYGSNNGKFELSVPDQRVKVGSDPLLIADSSKGQEVNYIEIPAHGYCASWKYQFYGVGSAATLYPLCQVGSTLDFKRYEVHPLQEGFAQSALNSLENAETLAAEGLKDKETMASFRAYVNSARANYEKLSGATKADVFDVARLEAVEVLLASEFDSQIATLLAQDPEEGFSSDPKFVETLAAYYTQHTNNAATIQAATTNGAKLVACYEKYSALDLTITYDFDGGYAQGYYAYTDKDKLMPEFLSDLYSFLVEKNAFGETPVAETDFLDVNSAFWTDAATYGKEPDCFRTYLFMPYKDADGNIHEDYMKVNEEYNTFFNDPRYNKWVTLFDFVNEATEAGNRGGQDAWGRAGLLYEPYKYAPVFATVTDDLTVYGGNQTFVTTSGTQIGALRFAQWVRNSIGGANYKGKIPHNVYATVFDRQTTQERYGKQIYHCTDLTVKLQDAPYKAGYEFAGWFFVNEDGSLGDAAVVTGSMFKDVTVKAKWIPGLLSSIEKVVGKELTPSYYPIDEKNGGQYKANMDNSEATLADQEAQVGIGKFAMVVGDKLFLLPELALIELCKDATADLTLSTKDELQVYGKDAADETKYWSTGIVRAADGSATPTNSFGHGVLYQNVSDFNITISEVINTYGRNLGGAAYGYNRYLFHFDAEKKAYVGTLISNAAGTSVTLAAGDFLWCPMTAERYAVGLTDCDGSSGVVGVLSDGCEVQIIDITDFLPAESTEWYSVLFYNGDKLLSEWYPEEGESIVVPEDQKLSGYEFLGWNTDKEATEAMEVELTPTKSATYYAIFKKLDAFATTTVIPGYEGEDAQTFATISDALKQTQANGTVTVSAGTYEEDLEILAPVTIKGPNAGLAGHAYERGLEAVVVGKVIVRADDVTLDGIKIAGGAADSKDGAIELDAIKNFTLQNSIVASIIYIPDTGVFGNNRRPMIVCFAGTAQENVVLKDNLFDFGPTIAATGSGYLKMPFASNNITDLTFVGNEIRNTVTTAYYLYATAGTVTFKGNKGAYSHTESGAAEGLVKKLDVVLTVDPALETEDATNFKTLAAALAAAEDYDTIEVKAGTYEEALEIKKTVTIKGPNAGKAWNAEDRAPEAELTKLVKVYANNVTFDGLKFSGEATIMLACDNTVVANCILEPTTLQACNGNNRKGAIVDMAAEGRDNYINNVALLNSYIKITCASTSYLTNYMAFSYLNGLYMKGNYITNTATSAGGGEGIMVYYMKGNIDLLENTFAWPSDGYVTRIGFYSSDCPFVNVIDNLFIGKNAEGAEVPSVTLGIQKLTAGSYLKIWHNQFINFNVSTFYCVNSAEGSTIDSQWNYFEGKPYKFADAGSATVITNNNCYKCEMHSANVYGGTTGDKADAVQYDSLEALETAYAALE